MCLKQSGNTSSNDAEGREPRTIMPAELRRLKDIADLTVRRVIASFLEYPSGSLNDMLERAYPFGDDPSGRQVWADTLLRYAQTLKTPRTDSQPAVRHGARANIFQRRYRTPAI
jgi:hypothetical protein